METNKQEIDLQDWVWQNRDKDWLHVVRLIGQKAVIKLRDNTQIEEMIPKEVKISAEEREYLSG